jgi:NADH:ubiquinone oxidoreductase subunit K
MLNYINLIYLSNLLNHELLLLSTAIFLTGFISFLESKEFLSLLISIEIMMLGINFHLITNAVL